MVYVHCGWEFKNLLGAKGVRDNHDARARTVSLISWNLGMCFERNTLATDAVQLVDCRGIGLGRLVTW